MAAPPIQYCRTDVGVSIAYWTIGEGPPVLLVNPLDGTHLALEWEVPSARKFYEQLSETCQVIRYGPRNSAFSDVADTSVAGYAADIVAVADAMGLDQLALVTSNDAIVFAAMFGQCHPARLNCTVALQPRISTRGSPGSSEDALSAIEATMPERLLEIMIQLMDPTQVDPPASLTLWLQEAWRFANQTPHEQRTAVRREAGVEEGHGLQAPMLIVDWPQSGYSEGPQLARLVPGARVVSRPGKGTWLFNPDLEGLIALVGDFVWEHSDNSGARPTERGPRSSLPSGAFRTILFTDVEASTELTDRFGDARARDILREHERLTREALSAHGGTEVKTMGDGFLASFSSASSALDAAIAMQKAITEAVAATETPIRIRVGINAGEPIEEDDDLYGAAVIRAARVMGEAQGGEITLGRSQNGLSDGRGSGSWTSRAAPPISPSRSACVSASWSMTAPLAMFTIDAEGFIKPNSVPPIMWRVSSVRGTQITM